MSSSSPIALGVDIGGTNIKIGLVRDDGELLEHAVTATPVSHEPEDVIKLVSQMAQSLLHDSDFKPAGAGVGFAGVVDATLEEVVAAPNFPEWRHVPLRKRLNDTLGLPTVVDNDVNAFALAEARWGAAVGLKSFIAAAMGTGLGGALFIEGKLFRGAGGGAGELGFSLISERGPEVMGQVGALEGYVGRHAFDQLLTKYFPTGEFPNPRTVTEMADKGDERAMAVHKHIAHYLAQAAITWIHVINPEAIILGGGTITGANYLLSEFESEVRARALKTHTEHLKILPSKLGYYAGLQGAAALWFGTEMQSGLTGRKL